MLTTTEVTPKQTVRNVESALLAHLGMRVSHKKICVATSEGPAAEAFRAARMRRRRCMAHSPVDAGGAPTKGRRRAERAPPALLRGRRGSAFAHERDDVPRHAAPRRGDLHRRGEGVESDRLRTETAARAAVRGGGAGRHRGALARRSRVRG